MTDISKFQGYKINLSSLLILLEQNKSKSSPRLSRFLFRLKFCQTWVATPFFQREILQFSNFGKYTEREHTVLRIKL